MTDKQFEQFNENLTTQLAQQATDIGIIKHILLKTGVVSKDELANLEREAAKTLETVKSALREQLR